MSPSDPNLDHWSVTVASRHHVSQVVTTARMLDVSASTSGCVVDLIGQKGQANWLAYNLVSSGLATEARSFDGVVMRKEAP